MLTAARARRERDWLMILVAYNHGLRATEVLSITSNDLRDDHLDVRRLKGSLHTVQPLVDHPDPLFSERGPLTEWAQQSIPGRPLFPLTRQRFWQIIKECGKLAGIPRHKLFPHALKHSVATHTIHEAGIENVRQWLGHRSLNSTGEYLRVTDDAAAQRIQSALKE